MYLNCHSYFSLRYGTLSPQQLAEAAAERGISRLVLSDINNTSAAFPFMEACRQRGITAVLGIDFRKKDIPYYIGIARDLAGWEELCRHLTQIQYRPDTLTHRAPQFKHCWVVYRRLAFNPKTIKSHEFIGVLPGDLHKLYSSGLLRFRKKLLALHPVTFLNKDGYRTHKLLRCIDKNILLSQLKREDCARSQEDFKTPQNLRKLYRLYPDLLKRSESLIAQCNYSLESGMKNNRQTFTTSADEDIALLWKLATDGCHKRYGRENSEADQRMRKEMKLIEKMGFGAYFLITWDIIRYAQSAGFHHIGRGSGANSIVAYCIGITDVDPLELDLYFERFINPYRRTPPDFDIDFSWDERDLVTDYIFKRYGKDYTALLATYNTFKGRSIIRELGKVMGLPKQDIDTIIRYPDKPERHHPFTRHIFKYGQLIEGFPNYLSIHAGGILISEKPIFQHTALQKMPKGFPITHFDMYTAEDLGFHKYDILSQRGLGHIKDAVDIIEQNCGQSLNVHRIEEIKQDPKVRQQLKSGSCMGCFYIESPAMRGLLHKLACDNYVHLVAASSIIRPGVAKSGMMREYITRFHHPESTKYLHPVFEEHLGETFGIMVYQEDVMKVVHHFAGLSLDESDVLRRIMSGKRKTGDTFKVLRNKYYNNCKQRGYPESLIKEVWRQIESFSGYSFCKAHSASFAVESFQSLYLKTYYPREFMVAVINNFGGFYSTEYYIHEARMAGAAIHPPCINESNYKTTIKGEDIYIGFIHLHNLNQEAALAIVHERRQYGPYLSFMDFKQRISISNEQIEILIRIDAFRFTGLNKYELMWKSYSIPKQQHYATLFSATEKEYTLPTLAEAPHEQAFDEIELLGFTLSSPFNLLKNQDLVRSTLSSRDFKAYANKLVAIVGYYVTRKHVTTVNGRHMCFGTWIDKRGVYFDTTHFPQALENFPYQGKGCYIIRGKVVLDFGFPSIEVHKMEKLPYIPDLRYA